GTISVGIDATDLFDRYEEEYEDVSGSGFPQIEINKMHISQSIEVKRTDASPSAGGLSEGTRVNEVLRASDTAILSGSLSTQNGNGGGSINFALRRVTSAKGWGELEFGAGDLQGPLFGLKLFRNLTPRWSLRADPAAGMAPRHCARCRGRWIGGHALEKYEIFSSRGIRPGLTTVLARNLDKNTVGYLQWRWGIQSAMNTSIVRDTKTSHFTVALQLGIPHSFALISYQHKFQDDDQTRVQLMQESVRRIIEAEESRMGLIIVNAWYGKFVNDKSKKSEKVKVIDVTVPLQCLVKDSKLILTEASKKEREVARSTFEARAPKFASSVGRSRGQAGLPGFYDPCVGEEKNLKVLYQFRGVLHQVMALDSETLRIPKQ
ncbi:hypothetical protein E2I00_007763, partial [Balaenoptera physalus]